MKKFVIIDGNSIAYRAFYALPILSNKKGVFTNAVFGFMNILLKINETLKPSHIAVIFDFPAKTFRHKIFKDYKATRKPMPDELCEQMPIIKDLLKTMGAYVFEKEGFEADDIIGTLSKKFDMPTVIVTGDRDCLQLIDSTTSVMLTKRGVSDTILMDEAKFNEEYGFSPMGIVDLKSLMGDSSDNIPGVKGIGEKGAKTLIQTYLSLENVYANIDSIKGKTKELLLNQKNEAFISKQLATIDTNMDINVSEKSLVLTLNLNEEVREKFDELELYSLLKKQEFFTEVKQKQKSYKNITIKKFDDLIFLDDLKEEIAIAITDDAIHLADCTEINYEIKINKGLINDGLDYKKILNILKPKLESENIKKICFNYKNFKKYLSEFNITLKGLSFDLHLAGWIVDSVNKNDSIDAVLGSVSLQEVSAVNFVKAKAIFEEKMKELEELDVYYNIELPLVEILHQMEEEGVKIDKKELDELIKFYQDKEKILRQKIYEISGFEFNISSPKQLAKVLFENLEIKNPKSGSTAINVLNELKGIHPIIEIIIEYRTITKILSTYLLTFSDYIKKDGFVHTEFNQTGTMTGRLSSNNPNLQNIPVKKEETRNIRKMFISRFDKGQIVSADYNQIELRLVASITEDSKMISAFNDSKDIHTATASEIFGVPIKDVSKDQRNKAKAVNFGIVYGISAFGLSEQTGVTPKEASDYIYKYYQTYPKIKEYMDSAILKAKENAGYVSTLFGRKRRVNELFSSNFQLRQFGERAVMNMPFQGTASDIIKKAMIQVFKKFKQLKLKSKLILQVHDELIVDATYDEVDLVKNILKTEMESSIKLSVPLIVDVEAGNTWFDV